MSASQRDTTQLTSDAAALVLTAVALAIFLAQGPRLLSQRSRVSAAEHVLELTVQSPDPPTPAPPAPAPHRTERHQRMPPPVAAPPVPVPVAPQTFLDDAAVVAAVETPPAAPAAATSRADLEALYAAQVRADIERRKHPPDSAQYRLRHPYGEVRVRFVVSRGGEPESATIARSSGSPILDEEALRLVSSGHYPPMPAQAFAGESEHAFLVTIEFPPAHLTQRAAATESGPA